MKKIKFNTNCKSKHFVQYFELLQSDYDLFRNKHFSNLCIKELEPIYSGSTLFLTHSATAALEMAATLIDILPGDEIIMPSFTFVSTANAFVGKGAIPVFVDIKESDLNLDESLIEQAITSKTKAVVAVHYAGHPCKLKELKALCDKHDLFLIEDAAMGFGSSYEAHPLGGYGDFGIISFDITKHVSAIQGGLLLVNNEKYKQRAKNVYHIGTNRDAFEHGEVLYYEWVDLGSKYQMNELNAAFLFDQLQESKSILNDRKAISLLYYSKLLALQKSGKLKMMPESHVAKNVHEFYIILGSESEKESLRIFMIKNNIEALSHYAPLHNSSYCLKSGKSQVITNTERISKTILRLPLHNDIKEEHISYIAEVVNSFFNENRETK